jgi:hypothetical protein
MRDEGRCTSSGLIARPVHQHDRGTMERATQSFTYAQRLKQQRQVEMRRRRSYPEQRMGGEQMRADGESDEVVFSVLYPTDDDDATW